MSEATAVSSLPIINLDVFKSSKDESAIQLECQKVADALITYGALFVLDSRVSEQDNDSFLDLMEDYFAQPVATLKRDERPELGYQVGVTLENTEKPKCASDEPCLNVISRLDPAERPLDIMGHMADPKCRFFWKMSEAPPYQTEFPSLNAPNVIPESDALKGRWEVIMQKWGQSMKNSVAELTEMLAIGLGIPRKTFVEASRYGPHLLAPTASDLVKYGTKDTILAGFHTDLNFLTIHGRSRYPGLHVWARNSGKRIPVRFPPSGRYLLVQAGKQLEHITGGLIKAGFHEVVVSENTVNTIQRRQVTHPDRPLIRISSTFFYHLSSDYDLTPIPALLRRSELLRRQNSDDDILPNYGSMKVGQQVQEELRHIALMA